MSELKKELKRDSHKKWARIKRLSSCILIFAATLGAPSSANAKEKGSNISTKENTELHTLPTRTIDYQVDTIFTYNNIAAYFSKNKQSVTKNHYLYMDHNKIHETSLLAHEQKHRDNSLFDLPNTPMSLEQHYKALCHNEISASIVELLQLRQMYIEAPSQQERDKVIEAMGINFEFYANLLKSTEDNRIDPLSTSPKDFDKEMKLIANYIQQSWMKNKAPQYHKKNNLVIEGVFCIHNYATLQENNKNYQNYLDTVYTIGGINFSKYMNKDIECYAQNVTEAQKLIDNNASRNKVEEKINGRTNNKTIYDADYKPETYTSYTGTPIYPKWSLRKRVSEIQYAEIYDFAGDGLKQYRDMLEIQQIASSYKKGIAKLNKHIYQRNKPTKTKENIQIIEQEAIYAKK
jgi:hypothetical protein